MAFTEIETETQRPAGSTVSFRQAAQRTVYLAGPISGLTHDEARFGWRTTFADMLPAHIIPASPMRAKQFLQNHGVLDSNPDTYPENALSTAAGIVTRDHNDVFTCDAMIACFLESEGRVSAGTCIEFGWAHAYAKPIIMVAGEHDPHRKHAMLQRIAGYIVPTLEEAAYITSHLLTPGL